MDEPEVTLRQPGESTPSLAIPGKPITAYYRPHLTRLPKRTAWRWLARRLLRGFAWLLVRAFTQMTVNGLENFPRRGPALVITNHLGDADVVLGLAVLPVEVETLAKLDLLMEYPLLGWVMELYGVIWVHRGQPDRRALRAALQGLEQGKLVGIAPEGRESLSGALEEGTGGAAYLALKAGVPLVPVTYTGTGNARLYGNMRRLRRTPVTLTVGPLFTLPQVLPLHRAVEEGTAVIMHKLAEQLPVEYRGIYR